MMCWRVAVPGTTGPHKTKSSVIRSFLISHKKGDSESEKAACVIQDFVFLCQKYFLTGVFLVGL